MRVERFEWEGAGAADLARRLRALAPPLEGVAESVRAIVADVRERGDEALAELAERFGEPVPDRLRVDPGHIEAAPALIEPDAREALMVAGRNIAAVARAELEARRPATAELADGQVVEVRDDPVEAAGVYAPGGRAAYPSSVLMCCVPAKVAGVARIAVASPPGPGGRPDPAVLAACAIARVDEVYAIGGAQAIAALAYGTRSVPAVDVVAGPGNRYVAEAKRQVSGRVGVDGIAGPSELMIVADGFANAGWLALDLCAQAEHGDDSLLVLASPDPVLADRVAERVDEIARDRPSVASAPLAIVSTPGIETALALADAFAPEHLQLVFEAADATVARSRVAGCVFLGRAAGTAFGDYAVGSNHVLPTGGAARFSGPLGPGAFRRRMSVVSLADSAAAGLAPHVAALARAEGFPVHGESAEARR